MSVNISTEYLSFWHPQYFCLCGLKLQLCCPKVNKNMKVQCQVKLNQILFIIFVWITSNTYETLTYTSNTICEYLWFGCEPIQCWIATDIPELFCHHWFTYMLVLAISHKTKQDKYIVFNIFQTLIWPLVSYSCSYWEFHKL